MIWDILAGFYVGMAVNFAARAGRYDNATIGHDIGAALVAAIWPAPYTAGIIRAFRR